ncbi:MAG TPA: hypothetical protein VEZ43_00160, partial [Dongiaceae bacterium]|nr:hypothetical protein [Dongiaceae bacterium]
IVEKIRYRLIDSKSYRFIIETSETISDEEVITNDSNIHVISSSDPMKTLYGPGGKAESAPLKGSPVFQ